MDHEDRDPDTEITIDEGQMTPHATFVFMIGMIIAAGFLFLLFMFSSIKNFFISIFLIVLTGYLLTGWSCNWERPCPVKSSSLHHPTTSA